MSAMRVSISPREKDRLGATERVLCRLLRLIPPEQISKMLVETEQVLMQAERLEKKTQAFIQEEK
jgi:hypothetical protein